MAMSISGISGGYNLSTGPADEYKNSLMIPEDEHKNSLDNAIRKEDDLPPLSDAQWAEANKEIKQIKFLNDSIHLFEKLNFHGAQDNRIHDLTSMRDRKSHDYMVQTGYPNPVPAMDNLINSINFV